MNFSLNLSHKKEVIKSGVDDLTLSAECQVSKTQT